MAAAGVGVAAAGAVTMSGTSATAAEAKPSTKAAKEPVVALIDHHDKGVVRLLVGEREVVVHDKDLATRILNAAGGK